MSDSNPSITASDIITDVEGRLGTPNISNSIYLPWVSYAYQKTYQKLMAVDQGVKEELFGNLASFNLAAGTGEYSISANIPRFGGIIKVEIKYGASGDDWVRATRLPSISHWKIQNNVSTTYRTKDAAVYYIIENVIGFIPTPPASDSGTPTARVWYVRRPYQITEANDVIDIDYRFIYPIVSYVQSMAVMAKYEDYTASEKVEQRFERDLESVALSAASEYSESEGTNGIEIPSDSALLEDPMRW